MKNTFKTAGYIISVTGVAIVLIWIGIFKFTPTEAKGIEPLVSNSILMSWLYSLLTVQHVSNFIGAIEILTGICLLLHFRWKIFGLIGGLLSTFTFLITLSFIFTNPGSFSLVDGVPVTDFFILKDLMALGISLMVVGKCREI